jgi:acyl-CoA synthetase (AMP-forming)/AMP-acid ligase II
MVKHPDFSKFDKSSIKNFCVAGAPITMEEVEACLRNGIKLNKFYGASEVTPVSVSTVFDDMNVIIRTEGRPVRGAEVKIVDEKGKEVPLGAPGEILARGAGSCIGYYENPEATAESFDKEHWWHSGDLGYLTEEGNLVISGRIKDMIIRKGENIDPAEIEGILNLHPKVDFSAVIGIRDPEAGEKMCAVIKPRENAEPITLQEIKEYCEKKGLAKFKLPERLEILREMPMTPSGKVKKAVLREMLENNVPPC